MISYLQQRRAEEVREGSGARGTPQGAGTGWKKVSSNP